MSAIRKEAEGYAKASICALAVDIGILWALVHFLHFGYVSAALISFLAGATVAYALSVRFAFKQHRLEDRRLEFASFVAIGGVGLALNSAIISLAVKYFALHYLIAKCLAAGVTFVCNFLARRHLLFRRPKTALMSRKRPAYDRT